MPVPETSAGAVAVLRWIESTHISGAVPTQVLTENDDRIILFQPAGSDYAAATGRLGGPRGRNMEPGGWDGGHHIREWTGSGVIRAHRAGEPWSTWRWLDATTGEWSPYVYVNLEDPWRRSPAGFDTRDWILDLVIHDDGDVTRKDEDELAWSVEAGWLAAETADGIERAASAAITAHARAAWPFGMDWASWAGACTSTALRLPAGWDLDPTLG